MVGKTNMDGGRLMTQVIDLTGWIDDTGETDVSGVLNSAKRFSGRPVWISKTVYLSEEVAMLGAGDYLTVDVDAPGAEDMSATVRLSDRTVAYYSRLGELGGRSSSMRWYP